MHARPSATGEAPECAAWLALGSVPALSWALGWQYFSLGSWVLGGIFRGAVPSTTQPGPKSLWGFARMLRICLMGFESQHKVI